MTLPALAPPLLRAGREASPGLHDVHRHGRRRGDQAADHTGAEMTQDVVAEIA